MLISLTAAWLEPQPSSEAQIKPEQTEDGSDSSSSSGSIEVPIARSRLLQLSRSNDLDGTTSSRRVRQPSHALQSRPNVQKRPMRCHQLAILSNGGDAAVPMCLLLLPCPARLEHEPSLCALAPCGAQGSLSVLNWSIGSNIRDISNISNCRLPVADAVMRCHRCVTLMVEEHLCLQVLERG